MNKYIGQVFACNRVLDEQSFKKFTVNLVFVSAGNAGYPVQNKTSEERLCLPSASSTRKQVLDVHFIVPEFSSNMQFTKKTFFS